LRVVVGVEAVPGAGEPFDDDLDVVTGPPGHLVADKLGLFPQAGFPDRAAELAQFVPDLVALARTVTVEPVRGGTMPISCRTGTCTAPVAAR
jgi:hypothetical protein